MEQRIVVLQAPSASGAQNYTLGGFGTPTACIVMATLGGQAAFAVHGCISVGTYDGTNQQVVCAGIEDGTAVTAMTARSDTQDADVVYLKYDNTLRRSASAAFITDGVELTWDGGGSRPYVTVWMFKGATSVFADWNDPDVTQDVSKNIATTGCNPNLIIFAANRQANLDAGVTHAGMSMGFAYDNGASIENLCAGWSSQDDDPTDTAGHMVDATGNRCVMYCSAGGGKSPGIECTAMGTADFDITTRDSSGVNIGFVYLALELEETVETFAVTTPTSTGDWDPFTASMTPQCMFMAGIPITVWNTNRGGSVGTESICLYVANDDSEQSGHTVVNEDSVAGAGIVQSEAEQDAEFKMMSMSGGAETIEFQANSPTFDASGVVFADANVDEGGSLFTVVGFFIDQPTASGSDTAILIPMGPLR